ncbi:uncharacterized protein LOC135211309 [Macrobrachium nipponense]|uniref:uncharacterized protein LOC135211309 n=1 Tax=Macrobrachium nipponense TaxID=159736 RepID=UPI0030C8C4AD
MHYFDEEENAAAQFLADPDWERNLFDLKRDQLWILGIISDEEIGNSNKNGENKVVGARDVEEEDNVSNKNGETGSRNNDINDGQVSQLKLDILKEHSRIKELDFKALQLQAEERAKERDHEIQLLKLQMSADNGNYRSDNDRFNLLSALKFVPQFNEEDVSEFFISFERIAKKLNWPRDMWTTLIQCRLKGKSQRVYNTLNEGLSSDYDSVKAIILKAYDLVPEAYRQKFRNFKKSPDMTFVEFAQKKEQFMDDWLKPKEVDSFEKFRELILTEEFKRSVSRELKIHLEELKIDSLQEVAIASDEYSLAHRQDPVRKDMSKKFSPRNGNIWQGKPYQKRSTDFDKNACVNRNVDSSKNGSVVSRSYVNSSMSGGGSGRRESHESGLSCYWCNRKGHIKANCFARKNYLERNTEPVNVVSAETSPKKEVSHGNK